MTISGFACVLLLLSLSSQMPVDILSQSQEGITSYDYFDPDEYMVGFGDQVWISFPGGIPFSGSDESISTIVLPIGLDGLLSVPGMPPIDVTGLNLTELQQMILSSISRSYGRLTVSSGLARSASFEVPVTGNVAEPGIVTVNGLTRLTEALDEAGGPTATAALSRIAVITTEGDSSFFDINDFTINGNMNSNPLLLRNSRIHVFESLGSLVVEGALSADYPVSSATPQQPSAIDRTERVVLEYIPGEHASLAIQRAGGISEEADLEGMFIHRQLGSDSFQHIPLDPDGLTADSELLPGDRIVIPFSPAYISVVGQVRNPSSVAYSPGMSVNYYIGMAGGFNSAARQSGVKLVLPDGSESGVEMNEIVPPGAMIDVPRVAIQFWQEYLAILTGVATVIISYQSISQ